jgi:hypothetical protein
LRSDSNKTKIMMYAEPVAATRTRTHTFYYVVDRVANPWVSRPVRAALAPVLKRALLSVADEDNDVLLEVQRGIRHATERAVLGVREERVLAFQKYVSRMTGAVTS